MSANQEVFYPGDRVEGIKHEYWRLRGRIAESHSLQGKRKVLVRWDGTEVDAAVPRASLKIIPEDAVEDENDEEEEREGGAESADSDYEEDDDGRGNDESEDELSEEEEGDSETEGATEDDEPPAASSTASTAVNLAASGQNAAPTGPNVPNEPFQAGSGGRGGRGRGRGGRQRGNGRGNQAQPATSGTVPPIDINKPPSKLHALLKKGNTRRAPVFREWHEVPNVTSDLHGQFPLYEQYTRLNWQHPSVGIFPPNLDIPSTKTPLQYFLLMFPTQQLDLIIESTNEMMRAWRKGPDIDKQEFFKFIGLRLTIALHPRCTDDGLNIYWSTNGESESVFSQAFDFEGKYGMSKTRFDAITLCLRLDKFHSGSTGESAYKPIQSFVDGFNRRMKLVVVPGKYIIVDECMSFWKGMESTFSHESFIHVTYIPRKPVNLGVEFKCSADGQSCIMLFLEIQKGSQAPKQCYETPPENLLFHCAVTLRTVDNWAGTGRVVVADAAFGSLLTCQELLKRGLYFIGVIKGCTKGFPVEYAKDFLLSAPSKNAFKVITTKVNDGDGVERTVMCVLYSLKPGMTRHIISSCSSTMLGDEKVFKRTVRKSNEEEGVWYNERQTETLRRPKVIDDGMQHFGAIDYNDRFRQGYLNWEQGWDTKRIWIRMFTTVLGIIATNAYFAYNLERNSVLNSTSYANDEVDKVKYHGFLGKLAHGLIFNTFDTPSNVSSGLRSRFSSPSATAVRGVPHLVALNTVKSIQDKFDLTTPQGVEKLRTYQSTCSICVKKGENGQRDRKMKTSYYCSECFSSDSKTFVCFCGPRSKRKCWRDHLLEVHCIFDQTANL